MTDNNPHENRQLAMLDRADATRPPSRALPRSPRVIHSGDVALKPAVKPLPEQEVTQNAVISSPPVQGFVVDLRPPPVIQAKAIKASISLDPILLLRFPIQDGDLRTELTIDVGGSRDVTVDLATKSVRKAQATIREFGAANVFCGLQGTLKAGDVLVDAGLSAQLKAPKSQKDSA